MPFGRHPAGIIRAIVDDPALSGRMTGTGLFRLEILIAKDILADAFAVAGAEQAGADRGTVPPSEYFGQYAHAVRLAAQPCAPQ